MSTSKSAVQNPTSNCPGAIHLASGFMVLCCIAVVAGASERETPYRESHRDLQTLDGRDNNRQNPLVGSANTAYARLTPANYADGIAAPAEGPEPRYISNRIFEDHAQNLFSENGVTQWAYNWGQFIDHTIGLRGSSDEALFMAYDESDPLETFAHGDGEFRTTRSTAMDGTGIDTVREQLNTVSSFIDAWAVYGGSEVRLEWLREGPVDGDMSNNGARLLMTSEQYLPRAIERGDASKAPAMERLGNLLYAPDADEQAIIAGDVRANENIALTAVQTLFAREHNRIVDQLPEQWSEQRKFDMARRLVIATQQYITYEEFLPALGVELEPARHYRADVETSVSNEFATVGFRAHSMIHGEIELQAQAGQYDESLLGQFAEAGIEVEHGEEESGDIELAVPLNIAFHRPQLVAQLGLGPLLAGLGGEPQYRNDEQIDNQLRSVLFQIPAERSTTMQGCLDGPTLNECFILVNDIGVLDIIRGREHGMASYNDMRRVYGLKEASSFSELTGEASESFPVDDPLIDPLDPINDPDILDFIELRDVNGQLLEPGSEAADTEAVSGVRRTTLAARLKGVYGDIDRVDAFVGMVSEPHLPGSEFGELQLAIWKRQFEVLRDGDRFFYRWNRALRSMLDRPELKGLTYRQTLADVIVNNTELEADDLQENMFFSVAD
ncbi:peroxidase family protein [Granulosicoccus sp. 3-233]